jgi:hypothetical protein
VGMVGVEVDLSWVGFGWEGEIGRAGLGLGLLGYSIFIGEVEEERLEDLDLLTKRFWRSLRAVLSSFYSFLHNFCISLSSSSLLISWMRVPSSWHLSS